jgi:hypothetical protein
MVSVGLLCIVLVVVAALIDVTGVVTSDESLYSIQAQAIGRGSWELGYPNGAVDPEGRWFPLSQVERANDGFFAYTRQPLYVWTLGQASSVFGDVGLHLVSLVSLVVACVAGAVTASLRGRRATLWAFWIAACSPLFVNAWMVSGHVPVAAFSGLSVMVVVRAARRSGQAPGTGALLVAGCLAAAAALLRADGIFVSMAVAAMAFVATWSIGVARAFTRAAIVAVPAALALIGQRAWILAVTGGGNATFDRTEGTGFLAGRIEGVWHSLLEPVLPPSANEGLLTLLGLASVLLAGLAGWLVGSTTDRRRDATVLLVLACGAVGARIALDAGELTSGLFAAWPVGAFLVAALVRRRDLRGASRLLVVYIAVVAVGVIATQYADGGSVQWGGRFFSAIVVPAAVLLAWVLVDARVLEQLPFRAATGALLVLPVIGGCLAVARHHDDNRALLEAIEGLPAQTIVTDRGRIAALALGAGRTGWLLVPEAEITSVAALVAERDGGPVGVLAGAGALKGEPLLVDRTPDAVAALGGSFYEFASEEDER